VYFDSVSSFNVSARLDRAAGFSLIVVRSTLRRKALPLPPKPLLADSLGGADPSQFDSLIKYAELIGVNTGDYTEVHLLSGTLMCLTKGESLLHCFGFGFFRSGDGLFSIDRFRPTGKAPYLLIKLPLSLNLFAKLSLWLAIFSNHDS
jgi:hypothetical protein